MNKATKNLTVLFLVFLLGSCFGVYSVQAQNNELILEVTKECDFQYSGDSCVAELKITNNTGEILDGETSLHIDYQGVCGNGFFDGEGIEAQFSNNDSWLNFSGWEEGTTVVSGFSIAEGEIQPKLKVETHPALCPGEYIFSLELKGTTEKEEYITPSVVLAMIGGGGGSLPRGLTIREPIEVIPDTTSATINWETSYEATSRVVYSTTPDRFDLFAGEPSYGYDQYTAENFTKEINHTVTIIGLIPGTTYYYRCVSHGSFAVSTEYSFTTFVEKDIEDGEKSIVQGKVKGATDIISDDKENMGKEDEEDEEKITEENLSSLLAGGFLASMIDLFNSIDSYLLLFILIIVLIILALLFRKKRKYGES